MDNCSKFDVSRQEFFEKEIKRWETKKVANEYLAMAYEKVNPNKAKRLSECSSFLIFREYDGGELKLQSMNSCRVRLCPLCTWRRTLRTYADNKKIFEYLDPDASQYGYILLTLTVKSVCSDELKKAISDILYAFKLLSKSARFKSVVKGWYRGLEVTHNVNPNSSNFNTYHPHIHCLLVVNKSYFTSRYYINHDEWVEMWKKALKVDYTPIVDVRRIKDLSGSKAVAEISKYPVKDVDYIVPDDWELTANTVQTLDGALCNVRLIAYGGILKEIKRKLKISDADSEDADLVHVDEDADAPDGNFVLRYLFWHTGYRQYIADCAEGISLAEAVT